MRALSRLSGIAVLAVVVGSCSDAADRALTGPAAASFARLANPTITETLVAEINAAITCAYGQDPKLLARKLREFEHIVELNSRTVRQAEAVRAQVNNFVRDSQRSAGSLTGACDGKSVAVATQELYNALYLISDQSQKVETPEYVGDAEVAVFIPGEELQVQSEGAAVIVPADAYEVPVIISLREITEPTFDPAPFAAAGTPIVPAYEFSVQPNIAASGDGVGRYICVSQAETDVGVLQLFRDTGNGVQAIPNEASNIVCEQEHYGQIRNPLLRGMARFASSVTSPFRPKLLYALQHAAIGGPDIFFSPHMVVRVATAAPQPDLVISAPATLVATPSTVAPGGTVTLSPWTVTNQGNAPSGFFSTGFYLSPDAVITTDDVYLDGNSNTSLPGGGSFNWGGPTLTIPANTAPGQYFIGIFVDHTNAVAESAEGNNTKVVPITVSGPSLSGTWVGTYSWDCGPGMSGGPVPLELVLTQNGSALSGTATYLNSTGPVTGNRWTQVVFGSHGTVQSGTASANGEIMQIEVSQTGTHVNNGFTGQITGNLITGTTLNGDSPAGPSPGCSHATGPAGSFSVQLQP